LASKLGAIFERVYSAVNAARYGQGGGVLGPVAFREVLKELGIARQEFLAALYEAKTTTPNLHEMLCRNLGRDKARSESLRTYQRERRLQRNRDGLCRDCPEPRHPEHTRCPACLAKNRAAQKAREMIPGGTPRKPRGLQNGA
jgi:hypothetical protein